MEKAALITGAASGIGRALSFEVARDGYALILVDANLKGLEKTKMILSGICPEREVVLIEADLSSGEGADNIAAECKKRGMVPEVLINCAGFGLFGKFIHTHWEREEEMINLHVNTTTKMIKLFLPGMLKKGYGKILNVSSMAGCVPGPMMSVYYATKAYMVSLSRALFVELKPKGIHVTVLCPGVTKTDFSRTVHGMTAPDTENKWVTTSAAEVAAKGWRNVKKGKPVAIPGALNKMMYVLQKLLPNVIVVTALMRSQKRIRLGVLKKASKSHLDNNLEKNKPSEESKRS